MRVRFAPSPTGVLHIGGARTALYNWLLARHADGTFILRIEDTDRERSTPQAVDQILEALTWLELDWDEGPLSQYERADRHRGRIEELIEKGLAYRSTATAEDVRQAKQESGDLGFRGEEAAEGEPAAVRLRVPDTGETVVRDVIRGTSRFENRLLEDFVIARSDGTPLYNLAVAVDDLEMGVTHVVRGEDHLSNTPKQLLIIRALGGTPPIYAHLPLLHGPGGKKLSKRHGAESVQDLREQGYLPEAVRNYVALLGWGYDDKTTFFTIDELIEKFSLERVSRSSAIFDMQKLRWMNGHYLRDLDPAAFERGLESFLAARGRKPGGGLNRAAELAQPKISTFAEFWGFAGFFFERPEYDDDAWRKVFGDGSGFEMLERARRALERADRFDEEGVEGVLKQLVEELQVKPRAVFQPIRVAICGKAVSPGIYESLALLGREESLSRIDAALNRR